MLMGDSSGSRAAQKLNRRGIEIFDRHIKKNWIGSSQIYTRCTMYIRGKSKANQRPTIYDSGT